MRRPAIQEELGAAEDLITYIPLGDYVVSIQFASWAPDLHWLSARVPGSDHHLRTTLSAGWSAVLRTVARDSEEPLSNSTVELWSLPGFDDQAPTGASGEMLPRRIRSNTTNDEGFALISGISVPLATGRVRRDGYVKAKAPILSASPGTWTFATVYMDRGGAFELQVALNEVPVSGARCDLRAPDLSNTVTAATTNSEGICQSSGIAPGHYAVVVEVPGEDASAIVAVKIENNSRTIQSVELKKMTISGHVLLGDEPAIGYTVSAVSTDRAFGDETSPKIEFNTKTDEEGEYELDIYQEGTFIVSVSNDVASTGEFRIVDLRGDEEIDFQAAASEIQGRVIDEASRAVAHAKVAVQWEGTLRSVEADEDGLFQIPFYKTGGSAEIWARAEGFEPSEKIRLEVTDGIQDGVALLVRKRSEMHGVLLDTSGAGFRGWIWLQRTNEGRPSASFLGFVETAPDGTFVIPAEAGRLQLFFGGPGCALGVREIIFPLTEEKLYLHCRRPANIAVRLLTEDEAGLVDHVTLLIKADNVVIPADVLRRHLMAFGLPSYTDGQGVVALVALEPGTYHIYHGNVTSELNILAGLEDGYLTTVELFRDSTVEVEVAIKSSRNPFEGAFESLKGFSQ
ncbi:MAG: carboxypeptidase regulatory-like domain-containing protein [Acidobacteria bacterium]|nr:MAG: carboxypeptidase regulatory-like domain-containing protein [Acidobacteriota bacterium]